jgi:hypothetical protein
LLVNADTVKISEISSQLLQPIGGRCPQVFDGCTGVQQIELALHTVPEVAPNPAGGFGVAPVVDVGGRGIPEARDHKSSIPEYSLVMYSGEMETFHAQR